MAERVLNFSEFFDKYSKDGANVGKDGLDAITQSSSNFETGFDDETYDQEQLGPNRPVSGGIDMTPPQPGENGAPTPTPKFDTEMAPDETEESEPVEEPEETNEEEPAEAEEENDEEVEEPEEESEEDSEEANDDSEENEEEEEEAEDGNPESKKESNESFRPLLGFSDFVNEAFGWEEDQFGEEEFGDEHSEEDEGICPDCGEEYEIGANPGEVSCGCNM